MPDATPQAVGKRVKFYRLAAGMTQQELADAAYMSANNVGWIENTGQSPAFDTMIFISHALKVSLNQLAYGETPTVRRSTD